MGKILLIVLTFGLVLSSCGKDPVGPSPIPVVRDNDDLNPDPTDPNDPNDPPPTDPAATVHKLEIPARRLTSAEEGQMRFPYKTRFLKTIALHRARAKKKECPRKWRSRCVKNRQVTFSFDLASMDQFNPDEVRVKNVYLEGSFFSIGKNNRTELLCLLNMKRCSGRGIIKVAGLPKFITKMLWWNQDFWNNNYESVVKSTLFHQVLEDSYSKKDGIYVLKNARLSFFGLFGVHRVHLHELLFKESHLDFTLTDDTYIENPKLIIELVEW